MSDYRTPEEEQASAAHNARVQAALDQIVKDGISLTVAMQLGEPADVVEEWINRFWNGMRDNLSDDRPDIAGMCQEDRLAAIHLLLWPRISAGAEQVMREYRQVAE